MNNIFLGIIAILIGYILGSIPFPYIAAKLYKGIDIRDVDNHNMGAGAVMRQCNKPLGLLVVILDGAKGAAAVIIAREMGLMEWWTYAAGFAALLGHCYPLFLQFRGGNGLATIIGIFLTISFIPTGITLLAIGLLLLLINNIFVSFVIIAPVFLILMWFFNDSIAPLIFAVITIAFIAIKAKRLMKQVKTVPVRRYREFTGFFHSDKSAQKGE